MERQKWVLQRRIILAIKDRRTRIGHVANGHR
jgi:hypothetical protein